MTHRHTVVGRLLAVPPLVWVGLRSYGLYLYSWPIYQIIREVAGNALTLSQFAVAMVWRPVAIMRGPLRGAGRLLDVVGLLGLAVLGLLSWRLHFITVDGRADPWLFRGGFFVT